MFHNVTATGFPIAGKNRMDALLFRVCFYDNDGISSITKICVNMTFVSQLYQLSIAPKAVVNGHLFPTTRPVFSPRSTDSNEKQFQHCR